MGVLPARNKAIFFSSESIQVTLCPRYARHTPVVKPTYPVPIIDTFIPLTPLPYANGRSTGSQLRHFSRFGVEPLGFVFPFVTLILRLWFPLRGHNFRAGRHSGLQPAFDVSWPRS